MLSQEADTIAGFTFAWFTDGTGWKNAGENKKKGMAGKKKPPVKKPFSGWIEGTAQEVICLGFMLDIGDIKEPVDSAYRKMRELLRLRQFLDNGEAVRIWYSDAPYSRCGFYHLCQILKEYDNEVRAVKLPEYVVWEKNITACRNWGNVAAEEFAGFLVYEKELSKEEVKRYAVLWTRLTEDNSPLRAVINGEVQGVPEDFYDFLVWKRLTGRPVKEARLIGDILGFFPMGISDWWYAKRIEYFIQKKKIRIVEDSVNKYARRICLAGPAEFEGI